jgi:hypothetical protein
MAEECFYSFRDLFLAAHHREMTQAEKHSFMAFSQELINEQVRVLAKMAGWGTMDKKGGDGEVYTAFCPTWQA